ncbi:hypothetical protein, partial [Lactobacillus amylovorus]|uniref:hypothetical protein n=1 Tax=Lactobacillus amylovorus TaxID=1604 RepID=UPI003F8873FE
KNKKHRNSLKIMNCCVFISGLKIEFFPRHFSLEFSMNNVVFRTVSLDPEYVPVKDVVWLNQINGQFAIFHGKIKFSSVLDPFNAVRLFI